MSLFGRDRLQPDQNPSLRQYERAYYDALAGNSFLDDSLQDGERSIEALSESESAAIGKELLSELRLEAPNGLDPGRSDWFRQVQETQFSRVTQRWQSRPNLDYGPAPENPGSLSASMQSNQEGLERFRDVFERNVLGPMQASWTKEAVKADLLHRHAPGSLSGEIRPGLSFDGHMERYVNLIQGAQSDIYLGQFMGENPVIAASMLQAGDRGVSTGIRTHEAFSEVGKAFARDVWSQMGQYSAAAHGVTEHFKVAFSDMGSPQTARALITSANLTNAALGKSQANSRGIASLGGNFESSVLLTPDAFSDLQLWSSIHQQLQNAQRWVASGSVDIIEKLVLDQKRLTSFDQASKDEAYTELRRAQVDMASQLRDVFTGDQTSGQSRILSGSGLAAMHREMLQKLGPGGRAILISYNFGKEVNDQIEAAVRRGADITVMHGARWEMEPVPRLRPDTEPKTNLDKLEQKLKDQPATGRLRVVQNVNTLVHSKVSVFEVAGEQGVLITGSMNLDDKQFMGRGMDPQNHPGAIRQVGQMLVEGEYTPYARDIRLTERIVEVSALTRLNPVGTQNLNHQVQAELQDLRNKYQLTQYQADILDLRGLNGLTFRVGGSFRLGQGATAAYVELGQLMNLTAYTPDEAFVQKGFGRSTSEYFVPELSKFIGSVRGVGWATEEEPQVGQSRTASGLEVLVAGTAAAQREVQNYLDALVEMVGQNRAQEILKNPYEVGRLRSTIKQFTKERFKNFAGMEPGTPAYSAKALAQLVMRVNQGGLLDLNSSLNISSDTLDKILAGEMTRADFGQRNFLFTASGLSRMNRYGEAKTARVYDTEMVNTLPEGDYDAQKDDFTFLMPLSKISQLPQRLQNIISARNLTPIIEKDVLAVLGADDPTQSNLVGYSRFIGNSREAKSRQQVIRFRGYALPGFSGDQNAYLVGERFHNLYFGNESFRKTVKIQNRTAIASDLGILLHEQLNALADTADSGVKRLSDGRYYLDQNALTALESSLDLAGERIGNTGMHMLKQIDLGLANKEVSGVLLDLSEKGSGLRKSGGNWEYTLTGVPMERITSGSRNLLGAKVPFVIAQAASPFFQGIDALSSAIYGDSQGSPDSVYNRLNMSGFNIVFGLGTIKTGKAFVETGIEMLETGTYKTQLEYLKQASLNGYDPMRGMGTIINRIASGVDDAAIRGELEKVAKLLGREGPLGDAAFDEIGRTLDKTAAYLNASSDNVISLGRFGRRQHAARALLAFGVHASYSLAKLDALTRDSDPSRQALLEKAQLGEFMPRPGEAISRDMLPIDQVMGMIYLSFTGGISALATPMSSRDRVNLLAYHRSGSTQALYDMMARSPGMQKRLAAFDQLTAHGLLGATGDVRYGTDHTVFQDYVPGLRVDYDGRQVDPYVVLQKLQNQLEAVVTSKEVTDLGQRGKAITQIHAQMADVRFKLQEAMAALRGDEAAPRDERKWAYKSSGSERSSLTTMTLTAEIEAGLKTQTLLIPSIDPNNRGAQMGYQPVQFMDREALLSVGAFENFAHEVIELQAKAGRLLGVLGGIRRESHVFFSELNAEQTDTYQELMYTLAELKDAQKMVLTSGLQKLMGGMLALPGSNMIIGTLPEVDLGDVVLSERAYQKLRSEAVSEASQGLNQEVDRLIAEAHASNGKLSRQDATRHVLSRLLAGLDAKTAGASAELSRSVLGEFDSFYAEENAYNAQLDNLMIQHDEVHARYTALNNEFYNEDTGRLYELRQRRRELERQARRSAERRTGFQQKRQALLSSAEGAARGRYQQNLRGINQVYEERLSQIDSIERGMSERMIDPLQAQLDTARSGIQQQVVTQRARAQRLQSATRTQSKLMALQGRLTYRLDQLSAEHGRDSALYQERNRLLAQADPLANPELMRLRKQVLPDGDMVSSHERMMTRHLGYRQAVIRNRQTVLASAELADVEANIAERELTHANLAEPVQGMKDRTRRILRAATRRSQNLKAAQRAGNANLRVAQGDLATLESRLDPMLKGGQRVIEGVVGGMRRTAQAQLRQSRAAVDQAYANDRAFTLAQTDQVIQVIREAEVLPMANDLLAGRAVLDAPENPAVLNQLRAMGKAVPYDAGSAFTSADQAEYQSLVQEEASTRQTLASLREERERLVSERNALKAERNQLRSNPIQQVVEDALGKLIDSNETVRALFMRVGMQRAGAPIGPDALMVNRVFRQSEYNAKQPHILLDTELSTRGAFFNIGAMGFFLGDFDGDTGSIFNLADYTRLRVLDMAGAEMSQEDRRHYERASRAVGISAAERTWEFARHYTGLTDVFDSSGFYRGLSNDQGSLEANRAYYGNVMERAEMAALNRAPDDNSQSLQTMRKAYRSDPLALGNLLFGEGTRDALDFAEFSVRQDKAMQVAQSVNQYVAEMQEPHNKLVRYLMDNASSDKNIKELYRDFFRVKQNRQSVMGASERLHAGITEVMAGALKKAMGSATDASDGQRLSYNVLVGYFIQTHFASSQVISKTFEFAYKMELEAQAKYAQDLARGVEDSRASEVRDSRLGTILAIQQMAREAIKPKGSAGDELNSLRVALDGANDNEVAVRSIDRIFERTRMKGLNWLSVLSTGKTMLNESVDIDLLRWKDSLLGESPQSTEMLAEDATGKRPWYQRMLAGLVNTVASNVDVARDMTWDAVYKDTVDAFSDYFEKGIMDAAEAGTMFGMYKEEDLAGMTRERRLELGRAHLQNTAEFSARQAIEMAINARGLNETMLLYRQGLAAGDANDRAAAFSQLRFQERALGFYAMAARGKFVEADAVEAGLQDLFEQVDHLTTTHGDELDTSLAERKLESVGLEVTGSQDYGKRLASIYRIARTQGTDLNQAMARSLTDERSYDAKQLEDSRNITISALEAIEQGTAESLQTETNEALSSKLSAHADDLTDHFKKTKDAAGLLNLTRAQGVIGLAGGMERAVRQRAEAQAEANNAATHGQRHVVADALGKAVRDPFISTGLFGVGLGTVAAFGAISVLAPSSAMAQGTQPSGEEAFGGLLGMSLAYIRPTMMFRQLNVSNKDKEEKLQEGALIGASLTAGIAGAEAGKHLMGKAMADIYQLESGEHTLAMRERIGTKVHLAGHVGSAVGGALVGTVVGLLAQGLIQRAHALREVNPIEEMVLGMAGFVDESAAAMFAATDDFVTDGSEGFGVDGVLEMVDEAGEYIDQTIFKVNWAAFDDDHGYEDFSGMLQADTDTFLSGETYEAASLESGLTLDALVIGEATSSTPR